MRIKVIGKTHMEGTSKKTDKPYNFNMVFFIGPAQNVEGERGQELMLDPVRYPIDSIHVGQDYEVDFGLRGVVMDFRPVK